MLSHRPSLHALCLLALLAPIGVSTAQTLQDPVPLAPILADMPTAGIPGARAGTERWIVHFKSRSFDLTRFREAILARRPANEVAAIVADMERSVRNDQAAFVTAAESLGARITDQWWIINALALELEPEQLAELRRLPGIESVQPDVEWPLLIGVATGEQNHRADGLQAQGFRGLGVSVGIMDTGQDSDMGGSGRPHRTYYIGGDPNNQSGGGIGGSRLLVNRQIGALIADDQHGHGTGVASISAGANWGSAAADDGHAPLAGIAGYAIANRVSGGASSSTTMTNAWQAMAADRAQFNIVAANLSYGGSPNPLDSAQRALDSAALNADIMCCVAAGNSGPATGSTTGSQSAVNGLAVGALVATTHTVASFSSRGPINGDSQRFYPDLSACGVETAMAQRNDESTSWTASGTSMASPQVCGAAAQLRARFPQMTALETKATLLAATEDIAAANPGLGRNDFGLGMLRNDLAHLLAVGGGFGTNQLTNGANTFALPVSLTAGESYRFAIAWHRQNLSSTSWSDLDLELLDPSGQVVASSTTPRNLYESIRYDTRVTGTFTLRARAVAIAGTTAQPFAFAWMQGPSVASTSSFGSGCVGSGPIPSQCAAVNFGGGTLSGSRFDGEVAYDLTTQFPLQVNGFEIFSASTNGVPVTVSAAIYGANGIEPAAAPLATTTVTIGTSPGFYSASFAQSVPIGVGRFWIAIDHRGQSSLLADLTTGQTGGAWQRSGFGAGSWVRSTTVDFSAVRATCAASPAVPVHAAAGRPSPGGALELNLARARPVAPSVLFFGLSDSVFSGGSLPLPLDTFGAPGCQLLTSAETSIILSTSLQGQLRHFLFTPNDPALLGVRFFTQFAVLDPGANQLGFAFSNALAVRIGE
ncbi:MAG: S8 family serine peptidase [Planctomycetota bacterium]